MRPLFAIVDDELVPRFCWCNKSHFFHLTQHSDLVQELLSSSDYITLGYSNFHLSDENQEPVLYQESSFMLLYVLMYGDALLDCYLEI